MPRVIYLVLPVIILAACGNGNPHDDVSGKSGHAIPKQPETASLNDTDRVVVQNNYAKNGTKPTLLQSERQYITLQEDAKLYYDAVKKMDALTPAYLEALYGKTPSDAEELYHMLREKFVAQRKKSGAKVTIPYLPESWAVPFSSSRDGALADYVYVYGDIDNLGYGWPEKYDPFSGENTPPHDYPFLPEPDDPPGTDRIMVNSGYQYPDKSRKFKRERSDGYTTSTRRPDNNPEVLQLRPQISGLRLRQVLLQIFVDDFQAPSFSSRFRFLLNGQDLPSVSSILNDLKQGGPIGKLVSVQLLPEYFEELKSGRLDLSIDSPESVKGDGFAIDFVRLLVNPKQFPVSTIRGKVSDASTKEPMVGVSVRVSGAEPVRSQSTGEFNVESVPCGMVIMQATHPGYQPAAVTIDLKENNVSEVHIKLQPESENSLQQQLEEKGQVELYGIYFDTDKAVIKPESIKTLNKLAGLIRKNPDVALVIGGHTDSQGNESHNLELSRQRAEAVRTWLQQKGLPTNNLAVQGYGSGRPVAANDTETGRALNRRVEIHYPTNNK